MAEASANPHAHLDKPLWRNMSFVLMWASVLASGFGDRLIQLAAMPMLGINNPGTNASSIIAGIAFFFFLPYMAVVLPAGWLADKLPRKWIMLACDESRAVVLAIAFLLLPAGYELASGAPPDQHWKVYSIIAAVGALAAVFNPARNASIPQIVRSSDLQRANAMIFGIAVIGSLVGFFIGGPLIEYSVHAGLALAVGMFGVSGLFFAFLKPVSRVRQVRQVTVRVGIVRYILGHKRVLSLIIIYALTWGVAYLVNVAVGAICKQRFGYEEQLVSRTAYLMGIAGLGMLSSAFFTAWLNLRRESAWFMTLALGLSGVSAIGLALSPNYALAAITTFGIGFFGYIAIVCAMTLLQTIVPDFMRGRVFAVDTLLSTLFGLSINFVVWRMPDADDWMVPVLLGSGVLLTGMAVVGTAYQIRRGPFDAWGANVVWRIMRLYIFVWHRAEFIDKHKLPADGPVIIAPNHTTGLDTILIQAAHFKLIRWVMLTEYRYKALEPIWKLWNPIALDLGSGDLAKIREITRSLKDGDIVGIFPEGVLQRSHRRLGPFQPGVGMLTKRAKAPIQPVWIAGTPEAHAMLTHFLLPSRSRVYFGDVYVPDPKASREEMLAELRERMLELARRAAFDDMRCRQCESDLTSTFEKPDEHACPSCGMQVFDPQMHEPSQS